MDGRLSTEHLVAGHRGTVRRVPLQRHRRANHGRPQILGHPRKLYHVGDLDLHRHAPDPAPAVARLHRQGVGRGGLVVQCSGHSDLARAAAYGELAGIVTGADRVGHGVAVVGVCRRDGAHQCAGRGVLGNREGVGGRCELGDLVALRGRSGLCLRRPAPGSRMGDSAAVRAHPEPVVDAAGQLVHRVGQGLSIV